MPKITEGTNHVQFEIGNMRNFTYLVIDRECKVAAIIDPGRNLEEPLLFLQENELSLKYIFLTHSHFDHTGGVTQLTEQNSEIEIIVHRNDRHRLKKSVIDRSKEILGGETVCLCENSSLSIQILHTPGHTSGSCCYLLNTKPGYLFSGDTIFVNDCGRTDLEDSNVGDMFASIQNLKKLPEDTIILPGHNYGETPTSSIHREKDRSPVFLCSTVSDLERL